MTLAPHTCGGQTDLILTETYSRWVTWTTQIEYPDLHALNKIIMLVGQQGSAQNLLRGGKKGQNYLYFCMLTPFFY